MDMAHLPIYMSVWIVGIAAFFLGSRHLIIKLFYPFFSPPVIGEILSSDRNLLFSKLYSFLKIWGVYLFITILFIFTGAPISSVLLKVINSSDPLIYKQSIITITILGFLAAVIVRIFVLLYSSSLIRGIYFQTICTFSALVLFYFPLELSPKIQDVFTPMFAIFIELYNDNFLLEWLIVSFIVVTLNEGMLLRSKSTVSRSIYRERKEKITSVTQFLQRSDLVKNAKSLITNDVEDVVWATQSSNRELIEQIRTWYTHRHTTGLTPTSLRIATTDEVFKQWEQIGIFSGPRSFKSIIHKSPIGLKRFLIIDKRIVIEGLPLTLDDSIDSNTGIRYNEFLDVMSLLTTFNTLYENSEPFP